MGTNATMCHSQEQVNSVSPMFSYPADIHHIHGAFSGGTEWSRDAQWLIVQRAKDDAVQMVHVVD